MAAKSSVREKERLVNKLRSELAETKKALMDGKDTREVLMQERMDDYKKLDAQREAAVEAAKKAVKREKQMELDQV